MVVAVAVVVGVVAVGLGLFVWGKKYTQRKRVEEMRLRIKK